MSEPAAERHGQGERRRRSTFLGGGIGYRRAYRDALLGDGPRPSVLEVIPDHFFADPDALAPLATYPIVFHEVAMSIGTADDGRPTIVKERMLGSVQTANRATQQLLRVDEETTHALNPGREAALAACHFLIDWLKTEAPFWKSEETPEGERWVEARAEDDAAKSRWSRGD